MREKLIYAERLKQVLDKNFGHTGGAAVLEQLIDIAPAVDAVEVVRCRDCRFSKPAVNNDYIVCEIMECYCGLMKDDFCVCGKRREENECNSD